MNYPFLTRKERDNETGLDYFLARYYSSTQGRFTSPDEFTGGPDELYDFAEDVSENPTLYADLRKPQSLNKYQYAYNNPLRWIDLDGHDPEPEPEPCCDGTTTQNVIEGAEKGAVAGAVVGGTAGMILEGGLLTLVAPGVGTFAGGADGAVKGIIVGTILGAVYGGVVAYVNSPSTPASTSSSTQPTTATPPMAQQAQPVAPPAPIQYHPKKKQSTGKNKDHKKETERPGRKQPPNYRPFRRPPPKPKPTPKPPKPKPEPKPEIGPNGNPVNPG